MKLPTSRRYHCTKEGRVRVWATFKEWPRNGETETQLVNRLEGEYRAEYAQDLFDIEPVFRGDRMPRFAYVYLLTLDTGGETRE
jgi:hypothetical protein